MDFGMEVGGKRDIGTNLCLLIHHHHLATRAGQ
jgi:hypothetical protein